MKHPVGICTWSLKNDVDRVTQTMNQAGLKRLHLDVSAADDFKAAIAANGWTVSSTMVAFPQEDYSSLAAIRETGGIIPDDCWEQNRALALGAIAKTAELGVPYLSTHAGFIDHNDAEGYARFSVRMTELADAAQAAGIGILMETGQETAEDLKSCLEDLNHPALGVNFDPANMILYAKGNPIEAVKVLAPWIKHVHIKDATATTVPGEWGAEVPGGDGEVGAAAFLEVLDSVGFDGAVAIEREAGDTREADIQQAAERLAQV